MSQKLSRRGLFMAAIIGSLTTDLAVAQTPSATPAGISPLGGAQWCLPIREPGRLPGDGFIIRHGFASENTWFNPGWLHTAEDWYRADGAETAGAEVVAITEGEVLWIGSEYPGRVVLVQHPNGLYGMYGHLDYDVAVEEGDTVSCGDPLGRVLRWADGRAPSHLHFEIRDFYFNPVVNGDQPSYGIQCGLECPPGPGYWPGWDERHPADLGWMNPSHVIARAMDAAPPAAVRVASTAERTTPLRSESEDAGEIVAELTLAAGAEFDLLDIEAGDPNRDETSALAYDVWYRIRTTQGEEGWVAAYRVDAGDVDSQGRPTTLVPQLLPLIVLR